MLFLVSHLAGHLVLIQAKYFPQLFSKEINNPAGAYSQYHFFWNRFLFPLMLLSPRLAVITQR